MNVYQFNRDYLSVTRLADGLVIRIDDQDLVSSTFNLTQCSNS